MAEFSDELLMAMALADGELPPKEAEQAMEIVSRDPELRAALEVYRQTGRAVLKPVFDPIERAAMPERILDVVWTTPIGEERPAPVTSFLSGIGEQVRALFATPAGWAAVAAAGVLAVAAGNALVGSHVGPNALGGGDLAALNRAGKLAPAPLARVLEGERGSQISQVAWDGAVFKVEPQLTFVSKDQQFCREYSASRDSEGLQRALACRDGGQWRVIAVSRTAKVEPAKPAEKGVRPAEPHPRTVRDPEFDVIIDRLIAGDVLTSDAEARVIANGWRQN